MALVAVGTRRVLVRTQEAKSADQRSNLGTSFEQPAPPANDIGRTRQPQLSRIATALLAHQFYRQWISHSSVSDTVSLLQHNCCRPHPTDRNKSDSMPALQTATLVAVMRSRLALAVHHCWSHTQAVIGWATTNGLTPAAQPTLGWSFKHPHAPRSSHQAHRLLLSL